MVISLWMLFCYIASIIIWNTVLKRNIGEAMIIGWIATLFFAGEEWSAIMVNSLRYALTQETIFAALNFIFMSHIMNRTKMIQRIVNLLNSLVGKIKGGSGYVSTLASGVFGLMSGSGSANAASVGSITIPWMTASQWSKETAATIVAGNAGLGIALGPSSSLFLLLGIVGVSLKMSPSDVYISVITAGAWTLLYRLLLIRFFIYKYNVPSVPSDSIVPFRTAFRADWVSLLTFSGVLIPLILTGNPVAEKLSNITSYGRVGIESISIIVWIPVLVSALTTIIGRKYLPHSAREWFSFVNECAKKFSIVGGTLFFAFAAGNVMSELGFGVELGSLFQSAKVPAAILVGMVGIMTAIVCGPLTSTASMAAIGTVAFSALTGIGVPAALAIATILIFSSTEGASPPNSAPIFIASGIAKIDPAKTFVPLVIYYVIPVLVIGICIALRILPTVH